MTSARHPPRKSAKKARRKPKIKIRRALPVTAVDLEARTNPVVVQDADGSAHGLGHSQIDDPRDHTYSMGARLPPIEENPLTKTQVYSLGPILDQGISQTCVGHSWTLFITSAPRLTSPGPDPYEIYRAAQELDVLPGQEPRVCGASVRSGAQAMQKLKWIKGDYLWADDAGVLWSFLLTRGPAVLASDWFEGMNSPDARGVVSLTGRRMGGHCFLCYGVSAEERAFLCANSWGPKWGLGGTFLFPYDVVAQLFARSSIVACSAFENA